MTEEKVIDIVSEQLGVEKAEVTRESSFVDDLKADSLDVVELVMEFEDEFGITIPDMHWQSLVRGTRQTSHEILNGYGPMARAQHHLTGIHTERRGQRFPTDVF